VSKDTDYFDIQRLFKVMDAKGWRMGKNFMEFWAKGKAKVAVIGTSKNKSTIGANLNQGLRIYTVSWDWLTKFSSVQVQYQNFFIDKAKNPAVSKLLINKYGRKNQTDIITPFNNWLTNGLQPSRYQGYIKNHQLQYIEVNPFDMNGNKLNDLVAALNGFNLFAFYKGYVISGPAYREKLKKTQEKKNKKSIAKPAKPTTKVKIEELEVIPNKDRVSIESYLKQPNAKNVVYVTDIGIYAGDIYEFNGHQYLATWNLTKDTVELSKWDAALDYVWSSTDTDDDGNITISNDTYNIFRKKTGKGGDFLALSPIKLKHFPFILKVN
jgi:hypothetical protein